MRRARSREEGAIAAIESPAADQLDQVELRAENIDATAQVAAIKITVLLDPIL